LPWQLVKSINSEPANSAWVRVSGDHAPTHKIERLYFIVCAASIGDRKEDRFLQELIFNDFTFKEPYH